MMGCLICLACICVTFYVSSVRMHARSHAVRGLLAHLSKMFGRIVKVTDLRRCYNRNILSEKTSIAFNFVLVISW